MWGALTSVDKMQGQEADFIYGRNLSSVPFTRARAKAVVFLPRPLLDASPEVLDSPTVAQGLAYMRGMVQLARKHGDRQVFEVQAGARLEVLSLGPW
jgi:DNA replication ATP-dependent helicase Dna2